MEFFEKEARDLAKIFQKSQTEHRRTQTKLVKHPQLVVGSNGIDSGSRSFSGKPLPENKDL
ncbi:MAG: hypothetical protein GY892_02600 [Shimia sp.]|nr:hypothetical protein [Shimia sp.]